MGIFKKSAGSKVIDKAAKLGAQTEGALGAWEGHDGYAAQYLVLHPTFLEVYRGGAAARIGNTHGSSEYVSLTQMESVGINREGFLRTLHFRGPGFDVTFPSGKKEAEEIKTAVLNAKAGATA